MTLVTFLLAQLLAQSTPLWSETFESGLSWESPGGDDPEEVRKIHSLVHESGNTFLRVRYDVRKSNPNAPRRSMYLGKAFLNKPIPLKQIGALQWRWRIGAHPSVTDNPWLDVAASVYVILRKPSLFRSGKGFKFAWLAKPGPSDTKQHGLIQMPMRSTSTGEWQSEEVLLCRLFEKYYGSCDNEEVLFIGVETDADATKGLAEGHYDDFILKAP